MRCTDCPPVSLVLFIGFLSVLNNHVTVYTVGYKSYQIMQMSLFLKERAKRGHFLV